MKGPTGVFDVETVTYGALLQYMTNMLVFGLNTTFGRSRYVAFVAFAFSATPRFVQVERSGDEYTLISAFTSISPDATSQPLQQPEARQSFENYVFAEAWTPQPQYPARLWRTR